MLVVVAFAMVACSNRPSHVEVLASVRADAPGSAWELENSAYSALGKELFGPGQHVVVTPLSDRSATEASVFDETIESNSLGGDNPLQIKEHAAKIRSEYEAAVGKLDTHRAGHPQTEIITAIVESAERFKDDPPEMDKVLIILSTGFEQSGSVNMGDASLSLRAATPSILRSLHSRDLIPDLSGVKVCMAGITAGSNQWADANASLAIKSFWEAYFRAAGARLIDFSPTLSATCLSAVRRIDIFAGSNHSTQ